MSADINALMAKKGIGVGSNANSVSPTASVGQPDIDSLMAKKGIAPQEDVGLIERAGRGLLSGASAVGHFVDSYTGSPTRSAIGKLQDDMTDVGGAVGAFAHQFGGNPEDAPTGKQIVQRAGVPDTALSDVFPSLYSASGNNWTRKGGYLDPTASGVAGLGMDIAADPFVIGGPALKAAGAVSKIATPAVKAAGNIGLKAADTMAGGGRVTALAEKTGNAARYAADSLVSSKDAIKRIFSPKQADDFGELVEVAKKNGIDPKLLPESVEFGSGSFLDTAARAQREGVSGEEKLAQFNKASEAVQGALENKIVNMGGGAPLSAVNAGTELRSAFDRGMKRFWDDIDLTHTTVQKYAPGLMVDGEAMATLESKLNGIEKKAKGLVSRGIDNVDKTQGRYLLNAVQAIRNSNGSYKQMVEEWRQIGRKAFGSDAVLGQVPHDIAAMQDLYKQVDDALLYTVRKNVNPAFAAEIEANNKAMSAFFSDRSKVGSILIDGKTAPEDVFKRVIMSGDTDQIKALKNILSPEDFQRQKAAFLNNLIKREADGSFNINTLYRAMRNKQSAISAMFSANEINEIGDLVRLGDRIGQPVLSTSGTGRSNVFHHLKSSVQEALTNDSMIGGMKDRARRGGLVFDDGGSLIKNAAPVNTQKSPVPGLLKGSQVYSVPKAPQQPVGLLGSGEPDRDRKPARKK